MAKCTKAFLKLQSIIFIVKEINFVLLVSIAFVCRNEDLCPIENVSILYIGSFCYIENLILFFNVRNKSNKCDIQFWTNNNFKQRYVMSNLCLSYHNKEFWPLNHYLLCYKLCNNLNVTDNSKILTKLFPYYSPRIWTKF